jgi:SAM-dependent methyltransferase
MKGAGTEKSLCQERTIRDYSRAAWDRQVESGNRWTVPVDPQTIAAARRGQWQIVLTPIKPVPAAWFPELPGLDVLCLASGGGQQGPILAAAGARVTVLDNSPRQLAQDRIVAEREGLELETVQGDMADLHIFPDERFDLIVHPVSNCFIPDVRPVWREAYRVLRRGGALLSGFVNPVTYIFDWPLLEQGVLEVRHALPYSDLESLSDEEKEHYIQEGQPFEFSHTLEDQIGGQIDAGFLIGGFYEDTDPPDQADLLSEYLPHYLVTRALKR